MFYISPPVSNQNDKVWSAGRKRDVSPAGVCLQGKGRLHFVQEKSKVNADYCVNELLPKLIDDCHHLLGQHFIFQQDGAPAHAAKSTQQWLAAHCPDFIDKEAWPPLDYHVWGWIIV